MKKKLFTLSLLMLLVGCNAPSLNSDESNEPIITTSEDQSNDEGTSVDEVTSETPTSDTNTSEESSEEPSEEITITSLSEASTLAKSYVTLRNEKGVYKSDVFMTFTAQLLTLQDYITTQSGYNNRYKAFVANETGHITVNMDYSQYSLIKDYKDKQQVYKFQGYLGLYNDEPEIDMVGQGKVSYQEGMTLDYDYKVFAKDGVSIAESLNRVKNTPFNTKGINWSENIYKFNLKYLTKVENAVALFSDGTNVIQLHSHDRINNSFSVGNSYYIYAREGMYNFKPNLEYIGLENGPEVVTDYQTMKSDMNAVTLYNYKYQVDKPNALNANMQYADQMVKLFYTESYANYYAKDGMHYVVLEDTAKETFYATDTGAISAKAMFVNNDNSVRLWTETDWANCPFNDYVDGPAATKIKIGYYFVAYAYNTIGYWQVQVLTDTIVTI